MSEATMGESSRKCPACGNSDLLLGQVHLRQVFVPQRGFWWRRYRLTSYLCMTCGFLSQFMSDTNLAHIRDKLQVRQER